MPNEQGGQTEEGWVVGVDGGGVSQRKSINAVGDDCTAGRMRTNVLVSTINSTGNSTNTNGIQMTSATTENS